MAAQSPVHMNLALLNEKFEPIYIVDTYRSAIWTDRYSEAGDFELYLPVNEETLFYFKKDAYLYNSESEHIMVVDDLTVTVDPYDDDGFSLKVTGSSLEYILYRRIIWTPVMFDGNLQTILKEKVFDPNIGSPSKAERRIPNLHFRLSNDPKVTAAAVEYQDVYTGNNLYEIFSELCSVKGIGFRVILDKEDDTQMILELYSGTDRSYDQEENVYVTFSPDFDNLRRSNWYDSTHLFKNLALVEGVYRYQSGDTSIDEARSVIVGDDSLSGLDRREVWIDGQGISSQTEDNRVIDRGTFDNLLRAKGVDGLYEYKEDELFEGEIDPMAMFVYGEDYFLGDIVQIKNEFGIEARVRIEEIIFSYDKDGYTVVPTFSVVED